MDIPAGQFPNNESKVRGRNSFSPINLFRESSVASSERSTPYYEKMNIDIDLSSEESHPELSYEAEQKKAIQVSMAANQQKTMRPINVHSEAPHLMPNMRKNLLIFNFLTIHTPPPNQSYGVVLSTPFLYMALSNTSPQIQKTPK